MPADTTVKLFHSGMTGAPALTNAAGSIVAVLDACLVNGFGVGTVDSVVVASNVATVTRAAGHSFEVGSVALIAGATPAGLNGEKKVLSVSGNSYTFEAADVANQTATGTITHKLAPLGWVKAFSGTNLAAYKSPNILSTGCYLRVSDTLTTGALVAGYRLMSDVSTGLEKFPGDNQTNAGAFWNKSDSASGCRWAIVGDDRAFYYHVTADNLNKGHTSYFGDFNSYASPDAFRCCIVANNASATSTETSTTIGSVAQITNVGGPYGIRSANRHVSGIGSANIIWISSATISRASSSSYSGGPDSVLAFPNLADNRLLISQAFVQDSSPKTIRGRMPGLYHTEQTLAGMNIFAHLSKVTGVEALPNRTLTAVVTINSVIFFDTTGPWR